MRKIVFIIFLLCTNFFFSQKKMQKFIDSTLVVISKMKNDTNKVILLCDVSNAYYSIDPVSGLKYGKQSFLLSKKLNYNDGKALSLWAISCNQTTNSDYKNGIKNLLNALNLTSNKEINAKIYRSMGLIYSYQSNFPKSLEYNNKALSLYELLKNEKGQALVLGNIAIVYFSLNKYKKAIALNQRALEINTKLNVTTSMMNNYGNLANCYTNIKQFDKALNYYDKVIEVAGILDNKFSLALAYDNKSQLYFEMKKYDIALEFCYKSYKLNQEIGNKDDLSTNLAIIGEIFFEKAKMIEDKVKQDPFLKKALENLEESLIINKEINATDGIYYNYQKIYEILKLQGKYKESLVSLENSIIYKDSIFNSENKESLKNLEDKRLIDIRDKEIKINKISLEAKEKQKWYLFGGIGLLAIIGSLLFYQSKNRKKINEKLQVLNNDLDQANKVKARFFGILNHDLRSPVNNLIHYLHLQKESPELLDEATKTQIESETMTSAENLLSSMEDMLLWSKGQMENFKPKPKNVSVDQLFNDTKKVFSGYLHVNFEYHNPNNLEIFTDENYLKTIIRNLTSNAINVFKTIDNPTIVWKAWQEKNVIYLSISDNGKGAENEQFKALYDDSEVIGIQSGLGLHLIRDLAKAIDCEISVDSKIGFGTTFVLKMK